MGAKSEKIFSLLDRMGVSKVFEKCDGLGERIGAFFHSKPQISLIGWEGVGERTLQVSSAVHRNENVVAHVNRYANKCKTIGENPRISTCHTREFIPLEGSRLHRMGLRKLEKSTIAAVGTPMYEAEVVMPSGNQATLHAFNDIRNYMRMAKLGV